jgi:hypothetical protein
VTTSPTLLAPEPPPADSGALRSAVGPLEGLADTIDQAAARVRGLEPELSAAATDRAVAMSDLVRVVEEVNRLGRACAGLEAMALAAFARRDEVEGETFALAEARPQTVRAPGFVHADAGLEVAHVLGISEGAGCTRVDRAAGLTSRLPLTLAAVTAGRIELWQAQQVLDECRLLDDDEAHQVDEWLSPRLGRIEPTRLRSVTRYAIGRVDPDKVRRRASQAHGDRTLEVLAAADPGLSQLYALIPSHKAAAIWEAASALGRDYQALDGELTADQARADAFVDLVLAEVDVHASVTLGIPVVTGRLSAVGEAPDGPDHDAPGAHDGPGTAPDVIPDWMLDPRHGAESCAPIHGTGPLAGAFTTGVTLPKVGHIPADVLAALLERLDLSVSTALIDACDGTVLQTVTDAYTPPRSMRDFVVVRDGQCRMYGCTRPAARCDLDHAVPYHRGGVTSPANLAALCRHHHRAKQARQWIYHLDPETSVATWVNTRTGTIRATHPQTALAGHGVRLRRRMKRLPFDTLPCPEPAGRPPDDPPPF